MKQTVKTTVKYILSIFLTIFFLYFAFKGTDFKELWTILANANYLWVLASFVVLIISHMLRAWRWKYLLMPIKSRIRYRNLISSMMVGYMMNNVLPRAGELVRPYAIGKMENISRSAALGTVIVERIFDFLSMMLAIILIPLVYSGPLTQVFPWLEEMGIWITTISLAFFAFFTFMMMRRDIVMKILDYFTKHLSVKKAQLIEHITHSFLDGFLFLKDRKNYLVIFILSILIWGLYIIMMYLPFYTFELTEKYSLDLGAALVVQSISSIGMLIPTPGATGPYHYFTIQTLTKLYNVEAEVARSYATVTHVIGFIGITLVGAYYFLRDRLKMAEVMKQERSYVEISGDNSNG